MQMTAPRHRASAKAGGGSARTSPSHTLSSPAKGCAFHPLLRSSPLDGVVWYSFLLDGARGIPLIPWCLLIFLLDIWGKSGRKDEFLVIHIVFL